MSGAAFIVVDLGFGDAGKGAIVDGLARRHGAALCVRFHGGAQAGHNVVTPDGRHHTFAQFGAAGFVPGVRSHATADFVLHPGALLVEARRLAEVGVPDALDRLTVEADAPVTTPFHQAAGRLRELQSRHGSCGVGVGETVRDVLAAPADAVRARHLRGAPAALRARAERARERLLAGLGALDDAPPEAEAERVLLEDPGVVDRWLAQLRPLLGRRFVVDEEDVAPLLARGPVLLEGAQGVLLDEDWGFHPHTTWSRCTPQGALAWLARHGFERPVHRLGVLRTYPCRHGNGPFPSADPALDAVLCEPHNDARGWQGAFRRGAPDPILLRYAVRVAGGLDALAVTHLDRLPAVERWRAVEAYDRVAPSFFDEAGLRPVSPVDFEARASLTRALFDPGPRFVPLPEAASEARYLAWLEAALRLPVSIAAAGPRSTDQRELRVLSPRG